MSSSNTWFDRIKVVGTVMAVVGGLVACDGSVLDVEDPDNVEPTEQLTPSTLPQRFAGMVDDFRSAYDDYVLYTGLHTDEFILAGTFPTRIEVDERRPIPNNGSIDGDVWTPLSVSRATADAGWDDFQAVLDDPEFDTNEVERGAAWAGLLRGYNRIFFAEFFCQSIFGGQADLPSFADEEPEGSPRSSTERMQEAVTVLEQAETFATDKGFPDIATAARIGRARAHMFLGSVTGDASHFTTAADLVSGVPTEFTFQIDFSDATPGEQNQVMNSTWGVNANIRWTVGEGTDGSRGIEHFAPEGRRTWVDDDDNGVADRTTSPGLDEWFGQGLLLTPAQSVDANLEAFNGRSPVVAQTLYGSRSGVVTDAPLMLATGWEARMIEAETALRNGSSGDAQAIVNPLLEDEEQTLNPMVSVESSLNEPAGAGDFTSEELEAFQPVEFGDESLKGDLIELARARAAGLWLTGSRQGYVRRLAQEFGDRLVALSGSAGGTDRVPGTRTVLWPSRSDQNSISLPVPSDEVDNNENIGAACPSGLP